MPICPNYPFVLVLIFPGSHLPLVHIWTKCPLAPMLIGPQTPLFAPKCLFIPMSICLTPHMPSMPICPIYPFAPNVYFLWCSYFLVAISLQVPICPKCPLVPKLIGPKVPICPTIPISSNNHLFQFPQAHLSQTRTHLPKCSFAPIVQCPFALVLIFPGGYFPPMPICPLMPTCPLMPIDPKMLICSTVPICLINVHLPWCSFSWWPFPPNAHLLQCPSIPKCPFALVLTYPGGHFPHIELRIFSTNQQF